MVQVVRNYEGSTLTGNLLQEQSCVIMGTVGYLLYSVEIHERPKDSIEDKTKVTIFRDVIYKRLIN